MNENHTETATETMSVQPLFDELEKALVFLPNEMAKKGFLDALTYVLSL